MGSIRCESEVARGSTFELTLPVQALLESENRVTKGASPVLSPLPTLKILIAEDNPINQKVITAQLAQLGQQAEVTNNGLEAMERLEQSNYDVVILDILMPLMNGEAVSYTHLTLPTICSV